MKGAFWGMKGRGVSTVCGIQAGRCPALMYLSPSGKFCFWVLPNIFSLKGKHMPAQGTALCETAISSPLVKISCNFSFTITGFVYLYTGFTTFSQCKNPG